MRKVIIDDLGTSLLEPVCDLRRGFTSASTFGGSNHSTTAPAFHFDAVVSKGACPRSACVRGGVAQQGAVRKGSYLTRLSMPIEVVPRLGTRGGLARI